MAKQNIRTPVQSIEAPNVACVSGRFFPNGTSAVDNDSNVGKGYTVARTGTGTYTVTLDRRYKEILSLTFGVSNSARADWTVVIDDLDATSFTLVTKNGGVDQDLSANAFNFVSLDLKVRY